MQGGFGMRMAAGGGTPIGRGNGWVPKEVVAGCGAVEGDGAGPSRLAMERATRPKGDAWHEVGLHACATFP